MKRPKKTRKERKVAKQKALDLHNAQSYVSDVDYLKRLRISESTRSWIECRMYELRAAANVYEHKFAEYLIKKHVLFIYQAPFVFYGKKIYFADFYLPDHHLVVEIDGDYHNGPTQYSYDKEREANFASVKIRTERIANGTVLEEKSLDCRLCGYGL